MFRSTRIGTGGLRKVRNGLTSDRHGVAQLGRGRQRVELLAVVGAECLGQRGLGGQPVAPGLVDQVAEPGGGGTGERECDRVAALPGQVGGGVGRGDCEPVRRHLAGDPAREERRDAGAEAGQRADRVGGQGGVDDGPGPERGKNDTRQTYRRVTSGSRDCDPSLGRGDAQPGVVVVLPAPAQVRCPSEIHRAGTRRSVPREAPVWKHLFFSSASGTACRKASPSSMVSMLRPRSAIVTGGLGRPDAAELLTALDPHHGVHRAVRDLQHGGEGVDVREVPAQRALPVAQPEHRHALGDREHRAARDQHERRPRGFRDHLVLEQRTQRAREGLGPVANLLGVAQRHESVGLPGQFVLNKHINPTQGRARGFPGHETVLT